MTTELEPDNTPHAVAAADMPRPVLAAAARKLFGRGGVGPTLFAQRVAAHERAHEIEALLNDPDHVAFLAVMAQVSDVTWAGCTDCGLGKLEPNGRKQSNCDLTVGCVGKLCVGSATVAVEVFGALPAAPKKSAKKAPKSDDAATSDLTGVVTQTQ